LRSDSECPLTDRGVAVLDRIIPPCEGFEQTIADLAPSGGEAVDLLRPTLRRVAITHLITPILSDIHQSCPTVALDFTVHEMLSNIVAEQFDAGIVH
jgi:DNA-binding transcriptional LysR family regulator